MTSSKMRIESKFGLMTGSPPEKPMLRVLALLGADEVAGEIVWCQSQFDNVIIKPYQDNLANIDAYEMEVNQADILIAELDVDKEEQFHLLESVSNNVMKSRPVIVVSRKVTPEITRRLLRAGARDVMASPVTRSNFITVLENAIVRLSTPIHGGSVERSQGHVISILKCGGGAGATTVATQTAMALAAQDDAKVCLIDLDIQVGAIGTYLDIPVRRSVLDLLAVSRRLDAEMVRNVLHQHSNGLYVLPSPAQLAALDSIKPNDMTRLISVLKAEFDYVVIDLPPAWLEWSYQAVVGSDLLLLVAQPSVASIRMAHRQVEMLKLQNLHSKPSLLIVNRFQRSLFSDIRLDDFRKGSGLAASYTIPSDYALVSKAQNAGVPVSKIKAKSKFEQAIREIAKGIMDIVGAQAR